MSVKGTRTVDLVANLLRSQILSGHYAPHDRLPAERKLAESLDVNRLTLRAALAKLESEGLIAARQGRGVTVLEWRSTGTLGLIPHLIAQGDDALLGSFLQLRRAVAVEAVAAATIKATDEDLIELSELADRLSTETDPDRLSQGDLALTRRILRLADNLPMELLYNSVSDVYAVRPELVSVMYADSDAVRASFPLVVALLRSRDPETARSVVRAALEAIDAASLAALTTTESPENS